MMGDHPAVSPWMLNDGEAVRAAGERLRDVARLLGDVEVTVGSTLGSAATALGWEGQMTRRAEETTERTRTLLTRLAEGCERAGTTLLELAGAMSWHGPRLADLLRGAVVDPAPRFGLPVEPRFGSPGEPRIGLPVEPRFGSPGEPRIGLPVQPRLADGGGPVPVPGMGHITPIGPMTPLLPQDRDQQILLHVEDLDVADRRCHDRLLQIRAELDGMVPHGTDPDYLRSLLPRGAWRLLLEAGIVPVREPGGQMRHTPGFRTGGPELHLEPDPALPRTPGMPSPTDPVTELPRTPGTPSPTDPISPTPRDDTMQHTPGFRTHGPGGAGELTVEGPADR